MPTRVGPPEQPKSPNSASRANMAVPPLGRLREATLMVPGHKMPTDRPHRPQPSRASSGLGDNAASR